MTADSTQTMVEVEHADLAYVRAIAADNDVQLEEVRQEGLEPVTSVTLIFLGTSLAISTVVYLLDRRHGGQVIDLRPDATRRFYRTADIQYGLVVPIAPTGQLRVEVKEPKGMFGTVVESITGLLPQLQSSGLSDIKGALEDHLGPAVTVIHEAT